MPDTKFSNRDMGEREKLFINLYKSTFPNVARYVSKMGGSFDEAKDVFQDALVIFYEKSVGGEIALRTNEQAYIFGVAQHLWSQKFRQNALFTSSDEQLDMAAEEEDHQPS